MHAVMITFRTTAPPDALVAPFTAPAHGLREVPGLLARTRVGEGTLRDFAFRAGAHVDAHEMARLRR